MASGSFVKYITPKSKKYPKRAYLKVWWESTPIGNNKSKVHAWAKIYRPYTVSSKATKSVEINIAGVNAGATVPGGWGGKGWTNKIIDKEVTVTHGTDGKKSIYIRVAAQLDCKFNGAYYDGAIKTDKELCVLDNLLTKTSIGINNYNLRLDDVLVIDLLQRKTSTVRHDITLTVGKYTHKILSKSADDGVTTSYKFTLDHSILLDAMPSSRTTAKVTCTTYNGTTSLGSTSDTFNLSLRGIIDSIWIDRSMVDILPKDSIFSDRIIYGYSLLDILVKIKDTDLVGGNRNDYSKVNTIKIDEISEGKWELPQYIMYLGEGVARKYSSVKSTTFTPGVNTLHVNATDNRGVKAQPLELKFYVNPYTKPSISNFTVERCLQDGTPNKNGTYAKVTLDYKYSKCNHTIYEETPSDENSGNRVSFTIKQKLESESDTNYKVLVTKTDITDTSFTAIYSNYSVDNRYNFSVEVSDLLGNKANSYCELGTEEILIDMYKKSVCIGGVCNRETAFEVNLDSYFEGTIYGTVQANTSDIRLKELADDDLIPLLDIWDEMTVVLFKYKDGDDKIQTGVIAQEIIELFNKNGIDWNKYGLVYQDPYTGYYSINYEFLNQLSILKVKLLQLELLSINERLDKIENK